MKTFGIATAFICVFINSLAFCGTLANGKYLMAGVSLFFICWGVFYAWVLSNAKIQ